MVKNKKGATILQEVQNGIVYLEGRVHYRTLFDLERIYRVEHQLIADMLLTVGMLQNEYGHWHYNGNAVYKEDYVITPVLDTLEALVNARQ